MIGFVSIALASYEAYAMTTKHKTVTELSHTWPYGILIYGWLLWLFLHFIAEANKA